MVLTDNQLVFKLKTLPQTLRCDLLRALGDAGAVAQLSSGKSLPKAESDLRETTGR